MHPLLAHLRALAAYLGAWGLAGVALAGLVVWRDAAPLAWALVWALPLSLVCGFVALSIYYLCRALSFGTLRWSLAVGYRLFAATVLAMAMLALALVWNGLGSLAGRPQGWVDLSPAATLLGLAVCLVLMGLSVLAHELLIAFERGREAAAREAQARLLAREMELQVLRMQIDPHFLFNALNSISALTTLDAPAARAMSIDLAQFLRQTLALADRERITLADELGLVRHFLAIEQHRLGDKLRSELDPDADSLTALLPPLSLQPLVENALKHGLRGRADGGLVQVQARVRAGWLHLVVRNPRADPAEPGERTPQPGLGLGLRNLRERLAAQYGARARIGWGVSADGFVVEISLPYEPQA